MLYKAEHVDYISVPWSMAIIKPQGLILEKE